MNSYLSSQDKRRLKRLERRTRAIIKIANGSEPKCAICGCPHPEILFIGHLEHRGGRWHRRALSKSKSGSREMVTWILNTDIEEVLKLVQLECPYCNSWHNQFKNYPPDHKQPKWGIDQ